MLEHQPVERPVVGFMVHIDTASHLEVGHHGMVHRRTVNNNLTHSLLGPGTHLAPLFGRGGECGNLDAFADDVGSLVDEDTVAGLHCLNGLVDGEQRCRFAAVGSIVAGGGHMDVTRGETQSRNHQSEGYRPASLFG